MLERVQGNRNPQPLLVGVQTDAASLEISVEKPQKAKN